MKHAKSALLLAGALSAFSGAVSADYYTFDYQDVDYARTAPGSQDYVTLSFGTSFSELDNKGASASIGYHHQFGNQPFSPGWGAKITSSLSSTLSEGAGTGGSDLSMRYSAYTGYVSSQHPLIYFSGESALLIEARVGFSATKAEGSLPSGIDEDLDADLYYGGGLIYNTQYDFQTFLEVNAHRSLDVVEVHSGIRVNF